MNFFNNWLQIAPHLGKRIFYLWWDLLVFFTVDKLVFI